MVLHAVVRGRDELVRIKELDHASLPSSPNGLLAGFSSRPDLHMDHVVLLGSEFGIVVGR